MGEVKRIIAQATVPKPMFNNSLRVELCENVHIHYRNVRLEFSPEEFLTFRETVLRCHPDRVNEFPYGKDHVLLATAALPEETAFDDRMVFEEQTDGSFHIHYRNLRGEFRSLDEAGITKEQL